MRSRSAVLARHSTIIRVLINNTNSCAVKSFAVNIIQKLYYCDIWMMDVTRDVKVHRSTRFRERALYRMLKARDLGIVAFFSHVQWG